MRTYLLTWSPQKWPWRDLSRRVREIKQQGFSAMDWSCGNNKSIAQGDRLFLLRQGAEPRGLVGAGHATSVPYAAKHWLAEKARLGRKTMYLRVRWETLLNPETEAIFPREWLGQGLLAQVNWNTQISGITIQHEAANVLERRWAAFLADRGKAFSLFTKASPDET